MSGLVVENVTGTGISVTGNNNVVRGNYVGVNDTGTTAAGNSTGVDVYGTGNWVGGPNPADRNVISGNQGDGVAVDGTDNHVAGNRIGTTADGTAALPNLDGVAVYGTGTHVGGTAPGGGNVISGNTYNGIYLSTGADGTVVQGNLVGTNAAATAPLANGTGLLVHSNNNQIGGTAAGAANVLSGNADDGVRIEALASGNTLQDNLIGVTPGPIPLGNGRYGVWLSSSNLNTVGGAGAGNTIGSNTSDGVYVDGNDQVIEANLIGVAASSSGLLAPMANTGNGIRVARDDVQIGGDTAGLGNVIGTNRGNGIQLDAAADNAVIRGNYIGTDATGVTLGNLGSGIRVDGADDNEVGTDAAGVPPNVIAYNAVDGITVTETAVGNAFLGNSIHDNNAMGIDLLPGGVTGNDRGDPDVGANDLQNFPVITSAQTVAGVTTINWRLNSSAVTTLRVEFFANPTCDAVPNTNGGGATFLGAAVVVTNANGNAGTAASPIATVPALSTPSGTVVVATATVVPAAGGFGDTSEFAGCVTVT